MELRGLALHRGTPARLSIERHDGPFTLAADGVSAGIGALRVVSTDRAVRVALGPSGPEIDLVEHLFAALGGLGLGDGVRVVVTGGEVPLLDGGSLAIADALQSLGTAISQPKWAVKRAFEGTFGDARYALEVADDVSVDVTCDYPHPLIGHQRAAWAGDADDFLRRVAPARTFGFRRDEAALRARGLAAAVDPKAVIVFEADGVHPASLPVGVDEPARHKLLDLIGDLAIYGGPPIGHVRAVRPSHGATHAFIRAAIAEGALA